VKPYAQREPMDATPQQIDLPNVLDREALAERLTAVARETSPSTGPGRAQVLDILKETLAGARAEVRRRFESGDTASHSMRTAAAAVDALLQTLLDFVLRRAYPAANPTMADRLCVTAVGGFGRGELAPHSDIDLLFLTPYKQTARGEQVVEYTLYMLWDLGLKVGHATRSLDDCIRLANDDVTIRTSLLEARYIWGERSLYDTLRQRFVAEVVAGTGPDFVEAKLAERDERHRRLGDSRYVVEPNVKDGKGGLRDLHTLYWIAKYLYQVDDIDDLVKRGVFTRAEIRRFRKAEEFLGNVRCHLHYVTGRPDDRLTFDVQTEIGERLNYTDHAGTRGVERFMKHYYLVAKDVGDLTRIFCAALEAEHQRRPRFSLARWLGRERVVDGFKVDQGRLTVEGPETFRDDPVNILRLFHTAQRHGLDVHPRTLHLVTRMLRLVDARLRENAEANRLFMEMLTSTQDPETTLRHLSEAGVLGRFIQAFGRVVAQMQYDMYHTYTVDEHTVRAIGILHQIEQGGLAEEAPIATEVVHKVLSRRALYLALFLHDIAKGRGGDHSVIGARIALDLGPRLGLTDEETETVSWLVLNHLVMSATAFKRDPNDPQTLRDFVQIVQSPERLRLLLVLTVADIRAVGPDIWNGWKAALLRDLYGRAAEVLSGESATDAESARVRAAQQAVRTILPDWPEAAFESFRAAAPSAYWLSWDTETASRHARMVREVVETKTPLLIDTRVDRSRAVTELTVCTDDHPGLFSRIVGAMSMIGANIVDARIFTLQNGIALDTFWVQDADGNALERPDRLARLSQRIRQALAGDFNLWVELRKAPPWPSRTRVFTVAPRVLIDNKASATHTLIEVNGRDRPGFLFEVTRALYGLNLQIGTARIATYGERAVDVFYVKDVFGLKIEHEDKLRQIRETLLAALADPAAAKKDKPAAKKAAPRRKPKLAARPKAARTTGK